MTKKQQEQDIEYSFPYHYVPQYKDKFTQNYNWGWGKQYVSAIEFILSEIEKDSENISSIVDVGCGDGRLTKELSEYFTTKDIVGIDYSTRAINLANALNPNVKYQNKDIVNDIIEKKFDAITLIEVFEHIPLELCNEFAKATARLLNKGGLIYLTVPHQNKPLSYKHFQHFSYDSLIKYFESDFEIEKIEYIQKQDKLLAILTMIMINRFWIVNSRLLNNLFYKFYKKRYFFADKNNCGRIYLKLRKK